jgi:hypothetical protein
MPFTPFHMGPALLLKPFLGPRFSVLVFGVSQVAIDLEPLVRILRRDETLHGWTHTLSGALGVGAAAALVARPLANWWLRYLRREIDDPALTASVATDVTPAVAFASAWIGTGSHFLLDGIMHADMSPFAPLSAANPLLGTVGLGALHVGCFAAGVLGVVFLAVGTWRAERVKAGPA